MLDERIPFLEGRPVNAEEDSYYDLPSRSGRRGHSVRTLCARHPEWPRFGEHGLPLMGSGDWNDGMNLVGEHGKGESVWLGFFLYDVLMQFAELARNRGDRVLRRALRRQRRPAAPEYRGSMAGMANGIAAPTSTTARRSDRRKPRMPDRFDCAKLVGSFRRGRCRARARLAMEAVDQRLVRRDQALIQLLDPPFDKSALNPGYIKGYVPGVRENGGQYTHAASGPRWPLPLWATAGARGNY